MLRHLIMWWKKDDKDTSPFICLGEYIYGHLRMQGKRQKEDTSPGGGNFGSKRKIVLGVFRAIMVNLNVARTLLISNFTNYLIGVPP